MNNYDATDELVSFVNCAVCEKQMPGMRWFSRIKVANYILALCCPLCHRTFLRAPTPYVRRIESLMGGGGRAQRE